MPDELGDSCIDLKRQIEQEGAEAQSVHEIEPKHSDRTQPGRAGTKAKAKTGEVLTTEGTESTEENHAVFLCALCALCGLALLMLSSFSSAKISPDNRSKESNSLSTLVLWSSVFYLSRFQVHHCYGFIQPRTP